MLHQAPSAIRRLTAASSRVRLAATALIALATAGGLLLLSAHAVEAAPAPTVTSVSPALGPSAGGTAVTITGTGFVSGAAVSIGGTPATSVVVASATSITAVTPAGTPGAALVTVTNADTQSATLSGGFTYQFPAPTASGIAPSSGTSAGGTSVTITGTQFRAGATVTFGTTAATSVTVVSATTITATTPARPIGATSVIVANSDAQSTTLASAYTYTAASAPTVTSATPTTGTVAGGTSVVITGTGFISGATVTFGGVSAAAVTVSSATSITATTPASASAGAVAIVVSNPDTQSGALASGFTYTPRPTPTITSITPVTGAALGGTSVTITGTGFVAGATVTIGGAAPSSTSVAGATTITAYTPQHAPGAGSVVVTNPDGQTATLTNGFTWSANGAPTATAITPTSGTTAGGDFVTITGTNFIAGVTVLIGGTAATGVNVPTSTTITAYTPAHAAGAATVMVLNYDGQVASTSSGFTFNGKAAPTATAITPTSGTTAGGDFITITGTNFVTGASVLIGGIAATTVTVPSSTMITAYTPAHVAGSATVTVINPDGQVATTSSGFTYNGNPAPAITSLSPTAGSTDGGTIVTITGTAFATGATLTVGAVPVSMSSLTATSIRFITPGGAAGAVDVVVTNPDGQTATSTGGFTYQSAPPTVTSVSPDSGPLAGGTVVTITGAGFLSGATVTFGIVAATGVAVNGDTTIVATAPVQTSAGAVDVQVKNATSAPGTLSGGFTYQPSGAPNVASTPPAGGIVVLVTGTADLQALISAQKFPVSAVYLLDVAKQQWKTYIVGAPASVNTLTAIKATDIVLLRR